MATQAIEFQFLTGLKRSIFRNPRLFGSWDVNGRYSDNWTESVMQEVLGEDGCPMFTTSLAFELADQSKTFKWGVVLDGPQGSNFWGVPTEIQDVNSVDRYRLFTLNNAQSTQIERYYFTNLRCLGANKYYLGGSSVPSLRFGVWAPNALGAEVVFGSLDNGYIADDGSGIDSAQPVISLSRMPDGVWLSQPVLNFEQFKSLPYMYRILNGQNNPVYRTDIFSRSQIGKGAVNPANDQTWSGSADSLSGTVSCSVIIDPDVIRRNFASTSPGNEPDLIPAEEFWATEFTPGLAVPTRLEDIVIYELHVGALGFGKSEPGDLSDAISFLDHLVALGVNAVELLPLAQFSSNIGWGYGDTHHLCVESSAGGRDKYRHFVRECHRRGIAVIQDVVYNHYDGNADRAEWQYDSTDHVQNIYYWYEGLPSDYPAYEQAAHDPSLPPDKRPAAGQGGYIDNGSTGYTPRFWEEKVRQQFTSAAAFLIEEMHVDGLRVDLTQAIHQDSWLHADGRLINNARVFGQKFLREWSRTLRMIRPTVMLIAEDYTFQDFVTKLPAQGGLGFDAVWDMNFYHSLVGDADGGSGHARLLKQAGYGWNDPLQMDSFSGELYASQYGKIVYQESHDEAGNDKGSVRTLVVAVNYVPLIGATRVAAEARSRVCFGLSLLSAGTPMFFMGEEIGAQKPYTYDHFLENREDILGERVGNGQWLFRFYQDLISLSRRFQSIRSRNIDILYQSNNDRLIAFKRWDGDEQIIIVASFNNIAFSNGYVIQKDLMAIPDASWREVLNSDASVYGGQNIGNYGAAIASNQGLLNIVVPASGFVVFVKQ